MKTVQISLNSIDYHFSIKDPASLGIPEITPTLGDISKDAFDADCTKTKEYGDILSEIDKSKLSTDDQITYECIEREINISNELSDDYYLQEFLSSTEGSQIDIPIMLAEYPFYEKKDVDDYILLLKDFDRYFEQIIDFEKELLSSQVSLLAFLTS